MAATYSVVLSSPGNIRLKSISEFTSLEYIRSVNGIGVMNLVLPATFDRNIFKRDTRLEIWRNLAGRNLLETRTQWLVNKSTLDFNTNLLTIQARSGLSLVQRRIIAYDSGTSQSTKSGAADSIIVEYVNENLGSAVDDSDRDWSSLIDIPAAVGTGPTVNKSSSRRNLLRTIQEIAQLAANSGTPIFFDMEYNTASKKYQFVTFIGQRGVDLSQTTGGVTFSMERKNITDIVHGEDYTDEVTFAYAAGQGQGTTRAIETASDTTRIAASPFGRVEKLVDARNTSDTDDLLTDAGTAIRAGRPKLIFNGVIVDLPASRYGIHWNWGDKVNVSVLGDIFVMRIDVISVKVSQGKETIQPSGIFDVI